MTQAVGGKGRERHKKIMIRGLEYISEARSCENPAASEQGVGHHHHVLPPRGSVDDMIPVRTQRNATQRMTY